MIYSKQQKGSRIKGETKVALNLSALLFFSLFFITFISANLYSEDNLYGEAIDKITSITNIQNITNNVTEDVHWNANYSLYNISWSSINNATYNLAFKWVTNGTFIPYTDEANLDVNSSTWWGGLTGWVEGWFENVGNQLSFNETKLNDTVNLLIAVSQINFVPVNIVTPTGTPTGNVSGVQVISDGWNYTVVEVVGIPGFSVVANFTNVTDIANIQLHYIYDGSMGHTIDVELFNVGTGAYDDFGDLTEGTDFTLDNFAVASGNNYISAEGNVSLRLYHSSAGNVNHKLILDYIALQRLAQPTRDHGSLTGLSDNDHPQYLLSTNWNATNTSYQLIDNKTLAGNYSATVDFCILNGNCLSNMGSGGGVDTDWSFDGQNISNTTANVKIGLNFTVDTNTFFVDSARNRIGVGTLEPSVMVDINATSHSPLYIRNTESFNSLIIQDANRGGTNLAVGGIAGRWDGNNIAQILFNTGDDTGNKDEGWMQFRVVEGGSIFEAMRIEQNGFIGIGTTTPTNHLHINSSAVNTGILLESTDSDSIMAFQDNAVSGFPPYIGGRGDDLIFGLAGDIRMYIDTGTGNVGISTITPQNTLNVLGDGNFTGTLFSHEQNVSTGIGFVLNDSFLFNTGDIATGNYIFDTDLLIINDTSDRIEIAPTGFAGFGNDRNHTLDVVGSGRFNSINNNGNISLTIYRPSGIVNGVTLGRLIFSGDGNSGGNSPYKEGAWIEGKATNTWSPTGGIDMPTEMSFWTTPNGGTPTKRVVINDTGILTIFGDIFLAGSGLIKDTGDNVTGNYNFSSSLFVDAGDNKVGIGIDNPDGLLTLNGTTTRLHMKEVGGSSDIGFYKGTENAFATVNGFNTGNGEGRLRFQTDDNVAHLTRMTITQNGTIGIGEGNPIDLLVVKGDVNITGCLELVNGTIIGGACVSDLSTKKNVEDYEIDLNKLSSLSPKEFEYKESKLFAGTKTVIDEETGKQEEINTYYNFPSGTQKGFVADEVELHYPEFVQTDEFGLKKVIYGFNWVMELWKQNQKQQTQIEELEARIFALENAK